MNALNISSFIWGIADDVLRDVYVRGKYRDVILPMTVIRRLDAMLEPTNDAVLRMKDQLEKSGITNPDSALRRAAGQACYNTSRFQLRDLAAAGRQRLAATLRITLLASRPASKAFWENSTFATRFPVSWKRMALRPSRSLRNLCVLDRA